MQEIASEHNNGFLVLEEVVFRGKLSKKPPARNSVRKQLKQPQRSPLWITTHFNNNRARIMIPIAKYPMGMGQFKMESVVVSII